MATGVANMIEMGNCSSHNSSTTPRRLCKGCGGDWKRAWLLGNITMRSLGRHLRSPG